MKLSILTVNYNTEQHIVELLAMLSQQTLAKSDFEIIITNNVQNDTLVTLTQPLAKQLNLRIVQSEQNVGFGRANNMAAAQATGEHLLIMNPDIRMLQDDYLERLYFAACDHPDYGIITTQIINNNNHDESTYYSYDFGRTLGFNSEVCWFLGALLLIKKTNFKDILQGFDPNFFMYSEDLDICYRAKKNGLSLIKIDDLKVHHIGGSSESSRGYDLYFRWYRSKILFALKHFPKDDFEKLLISQKYKTLLKLYLYITLSKIGLKKFKVKADRWQARFDVLERTKLSTDWLAFRLDCFDKKYNYSHHVSARLCDLTYKSNWR